MKNFLKLLSHIHTSLSPDTLSFFLWLRSTCVYCQNFHFCVTSQPLSPLQGHCFSNSLSLHHQFYSLCWVIPISMHTYCYGSVFKENPSLDPIPLQLLSHFSASFYGNTQNNFLYPLSLIKFLLFFLVLIPTRLSLPSFY